ncbi:hypothetical protein A5886_000825 [Enterococcus sp. 8G7_MSG3316]|uniref:Uncharacterized protein n=1 Tax=Candidatus Enterococcus testudinis TaxID=1834191 RepID=A0A242A4A4_9ENTE|nr:hypothetical protein [Enterococcus sp. 8G7_MSG3316]OTN75749.1 hypothetical protein A5886_000825 [Enterococcus sp. 8G7_MSG3316]
MRKNKVFFFILLCGICIGVFYHLTESNHPWRKTAVSERDDPPLSVTPLANANKIYTQLPDLLYDSGIQSLEEAPIVAMGTVADQTIYVTDTVTLIGDTSFTKDVTEENSTSETLENGIVQTVVTKPDLVFDVAETDTYFYMITLFVPEEIASVPSDLTVRVNKKEIDAVEETVKQRGVQAGFNEWTAGFYIPADDIDGSNPVIDCQIRIGQEVLTYTCTEDANQ